MKRMIEDAELLRRYVEEKSEPAFAEIVQRHLDLVYAAALRRAGGDAHAAADVAQQVFIQVARRAASLSRGVVLPAWLYNTTRNIAVSHVRAERRRRRLEQEAAIMSEASQEESRTAEWERIRPLLDASMDELGERDREAVVLRCLAHRPFADIGAALKMSDDAARMRVDRALEKLRALLARRGVTSTGAALGLVLANEAACAVPVGLAASVTGAALAGGSGAAGLFTFMSVNKTTTGVLATIAAMLALNVGQQRANARLRDEFGLLAREFQSLQPMVAENERLASQAAELVAGSADADELARLRARAGELRKKHMMRLGGGARLPEEALERRFRGGRSSPMQAWQTLFRMTRDERRGLTRDEVFDLQALVFCLDSEARTRVTAFIEALPEPERSVFRTPERLLAPVFDQWLWKGDSPRGYSSDEEGDAFIDGDPNRAYTSWRVTYSSGRVQVDRFPFVRFSDGWRYGPLLKSDVEQMLALLDPMTGRPKVAGDVSGSQSMSP